MKTSSRGHYRIQGSYGICIVLLCVVLSASCPRRTDVQSPGSSNVASSFVAQPYGGKLEKDDGQWVRPAKDFASTRYSSLDQINRDSVKQLKLAWTFSTGTLH